MGNFMDYINKKQAETGETAQKAAGDLRSYIEEKKAFSIPELQLAFHLPYYEVLHFLNEQIRRGTVVYDAGVTYRAVEQKKPEQSEENDVGENLFRRFLEARRAEQLAQYRQQAEKFDKLSDDDDEDEDDDDEDEDEDENMCLISAVTWTDSIRNFADSMELRVENEETFVTLPQFEKYAERKCFKVFEMNDCLFASDQGTTAAALRKANQDEDTIQKRMRDAAHRYDLRIFDDELVADLNDESTLVAGLIQLYFAMELLCKTAN